MAVKIRLARFGRNKQPFYHVVVADSRNRRDSNFIEKIGTYNPFLEDDNKEKFVIKKDRAEYWLSVGAIPTERTAIILNKLGVKGSEKYKPVFIPKEKVKEEVKVEEENLVVETVETTTQNESVETTTQETQE